MKEMKRDKLTEQQDSAAHAALHARERIETAVNAGELPLWVMDVCTILENASMTYGATSERIKLRLLDEGLPAGGITLH